MTEKSPLENLPEGCSHLYGTLFTVPFASIQVSDAPLEKGGSEYKFSNPRMNTEHGTSELMDKKQSAELRESIKNRTLLNPFVCRWVSENGKYVPHLVGGERRYRSVDFLIRKKEIVADPRSVHVNESGEWEYKRVSAAEAYNVVPCLIFNVNNDLDALALAWAENKTRINLTEGHEVAEVIKLRKCNASDERILDILQRDEKWLQETDRLIANLDQNTMGDLLESRMTRACAAELSAVEDTDMRDQIRIRANEAAKETCERKVQRIQKSLEDALDQREIAEGGVAEAEFHKDAEGIEGAKAQVAEAEKKVTRIAKERDAETPVATAKNVRDAKAELTGENGEEATPKMMRSAKVKDCVNLIDDLIKSGGEGEGFQADVTALKMVRRVLNDNILKNDPDVLATIKRCSK